MYEGGLWARGAGFARHTTSREPSVCWVPAQRPWPDTDWQKNSEGTSLPLQRPRSQVPPGHCMSSCSGRA
eukprot:11225598-Alexandrium_andersonii.AAC.1